jgi:hypothetical protein
MSKDSEENKLAAEIIISALKYRFRRLKAMRKRTGAIVFIAKSDRRKRQAEQFNKEIGLKVGTLEVAQERLVNDFGRLIELDNEASKPFAALADAFKSADESVTWRSVDLMYTDGSREKAIVNHAGTAESEKFWNDSVQEMRRFYNTAGLIQFKVES